MTSWLDVPHTDGNVVAFGAAMLAWVGLWVVSLMNQRKAEGGGKRDALSLLGIIIQGLGIGAAWFGRMTMRLDTSPPAWIEAAPTIAVAALSLALFAWAVRTMGANWAVVAQTRSDHQLVQSGPFALMRNPIYVAIFGMMVATALSLGHAWNLVVAAPLFLIGTLIRVGLEEKLLRATFGAPYDDYRKRVKRFVPAIW